MDEPRLSEREREIVALVARGLSNREAAERLGVEISTVNSHVHNALKKLGLRNRVELARWEAAQDRRSKHQ